LGGGIFSELQDLIQTLMIEARTNPVHYRATNSLQDSFELPRIGIVQSFHTEFNIAFKKNSSSEPKIYLLIDLHTCLFSCHNPLNSFPVEPQNA